jgi:hypothetical protein
MTTSALQVLAFCVYASTVPLLAVWGIRLIAYRDKIAQKKAIKRGSVPSLYYTLSRWFGQTEEDIERIRGVTVSQGISVLLLAAFIAYALSTRFTAVFAK